MRKKRSSKIKAEAPIERIGRLKNHPFVIPVVTFMVLFFAVMVGFIGFSGTTVGATDSRIVRLRVDNEERVLPTRADTVADLLERLGIEVGEADIVEPELDTPIEIDNLVVNIYKARPVMVVDGGKKTVTFTAAPTPEGVAQSLGIEVFPEDRISHEPVAHPVSTDLTTEGVIAEQVIIERAAVAHLNLYGTPVEVRTHAETVGELLVEKDIQLNQGDTIQPAPETPLAEGIEVFIVRVGTQIAQVEEMIAPPVETVDDFNLTMGATSVKEPGKPGKKLVTYEIEQQNGVEVARRVIQEVIIEQPVRSVVGKGRRAPVVAGNKAEIMAAAGISSNEFYAADFIISHESGWRVNALNARGCAGLGQACPGSKLAAVCPDWQSDAVCQMRFFSGYARNRYGSWSRAMEEWQRKRWW